MRGNALQDTIVESAETFSLALSEVSGVANVGPPASVTILDDEPILSLNITDLAKERLVHFTMPLPYGNWDWMIEASTNLKDWAPVGRIYGEIYGYGLTHSEDRSVSSRFYRAVQP